MRYYVSKCHDTMNGVSYTPEKYSPYLCVNPYYKTTVCDDSVKFMIDSGAFQDVGDEKRLSFEDALKRQLDFEKTVTRNQRPAEAIVSYDRLVDEQYGEQGQYKERVSEEISGEYVKETIDASRYLTSKRDSLFPRKLILSCQGTTTDQYIYCLNEILKVANKEDIIGFGGFCIISKSNKYEMQFYDVIKRAFPMIKNAGIKRVHIFGVGILRVLMQTEIWAKENDLICSYDTSSCEVNSVFGRAFDPVNASITSIFNKNQKKNGYIPSELAEFNVRNIVCFWDGFDKLSLPNSFEPGMLNKKLKTKTMKNIESKQTSLERYLEGL